MDEKFEITMLGSGAMGCYYGAQLQHAGCDVLLLDIFQEHIDKLNKDGLTLMRPDGSTASVPVKAANAASSGLRPADVLVVFVDTNALDGILSGIIPLLKPDGYVLTLQNGVGNLEKLVASLGPERVIAGTSMNSCEFLGPGHVRHVIHGTTIIGEAGGEAVSDRVERLCAILAKVDDKIEQVADIVPHIWSKLVINCAVNPLCALTGLLPGQLQEVPQTRALQEQIVAEIVALCDGKGIRLPDLDLPDSDPINEVWRKSRGGANKPSMVQHLESGRKTEIDALNGAVSRLAAELNIATPVNTTIAELIKGLETGGGLDIPL